ncbi:precorrin-3B synthase [Agrobacterium larrymoorei]|uniref:Precorrin-3B synthase n=1 Tax=Agrobacterium larrymoorei TaxID=160699 RepID=A0AAJ2BEX0_9HYPH|nr:precorrin-3B synthase [Agrobacterium larrymoorei]MDR6103702.1 precorrin-3B synthase [Agrobacterium larrymoorei]
MNPLPQVQPFSRRGVCPALSAPMQTGDGLLSRVAFTAPLSPSDLDRLGDLARRHGNGLLDVTARGSLQFRGLTAESAVELEHDVLALQLPLRQGLAVEGSPLAGIDDSEVANPGPILELISHKATALGLDAKLAAKMSVIVDGDGRAPMGGLLADIRLKAAQRDGDVLWLLMLGGTEEKALLVGALRTEDAADCVIDLLIHLAERGPDARGRDLDRAAAHNICSDRFLPISSDVRAPPRDIGTLSQTDERRLWSLNDHLHAAVIAPAFGQITSEALSALCQIAGDLGVRSIRPGPLHGLYALGDRNACAALLDYAQKAGLIVSDNDPRTAIAVCAGAPSCASAYTPVQALAAFAAKECGTMLDGSFTLHLSGCGKGCAHPAPALLAFSGTSEGFAFGYQAKVSALPDAQLTIDQQKAGLSRLARLYEKEHKPGENARTFLVRLGKDRIVAALRQDEI